MATVVQPIIEPDQGAIKAHLEALFAPVREEYPQGLIELCYGSAKPDRAMYFAVDSASIDRAVEFATGRNREGQNVYVGVNPRKTNVDRKRRGADTDVELAFFHFADLDRAEAVEKARTNLPIRPTMIVMTGTVPNNRPHFYWQLEEPMGNLAAWTEGQRGIAQNLGGDAVINPSRIMRLGGTVNYPTQDKLGRGYRMELVSVRTEFQIERGPVAAAEIARAFPASRQVSDFSGHLPQGATTLGLMGGKTRLLINSALQGNNWHNSIRDLTSRLARLGRTTDEILLMAPGLTLPGYTVENTLQEMRTAIAGARVKFNIPEPADEEVLGEDPDIFPSLSLDELEDLPPPTWLIDGLLPEHGLSIVYGDPGAGKSFLVLDAALRIAHGMDWHGSKTKQAGVLYIAGEGRHGIGKRVKGWRREHGLEGADAPFKLIPVAIKMLDPPSIERLKRTIHAISQEVSFEIGLVIIDTVSRSIAGQDENKQEAMSALVDGCASVQEFTNGAVIGVHHAGKDKEKGMRGSSVLLGACDASIKVKKDGETVTLVVEKQKDDEEAAPIYMTMKKVEWGTGLGEAQSTLVPFKTGVPSTEQRTLSKRQALEIFEEIQKAWTAGNPWSAFPQSKRKGRYVVDFIVDQYEVSPRIAEDHITKWQSREYLKSEPGGANKAAGLKVLRYLEPDQ